jgi:hypothetical protein
VKRKPARKPAKKRRAAEVRGVLLPGGQIQGTLFPIVLRPDAEVRAEQDGEVVAGGIPIAVLDELRTKAAAILEDVRKWEMDRSVERLSPHPVSRRPRTRVSYTAEESVLRDLVGKIAEAAFEVAAARYRPEIAALVARLKRQTRLLEQRRDGGESLAEEGRAARSKKRADNDRILCKLYQSVRGSFRTGGKGNTAALDVVRQRHQRKTNRDRPVTRKTVRNALKRCGVPCR